MLCDDASEYVSALCDGETIPPEPAKHISSCSVCLAQLSEYLTIGVELRRIASVEFFDPAPLRRWAKSQNILSAWWQKGWGTIRIPKLAFASLIAGVLVLISTLALVKVRANGGGTVVLLSISAGAGQPMECALSTEGSGNRSCARIENEENQNILAYQVEILSRSDDRIRLGFRSKAWPLTSIGEDSHSVDDLNREPQQEYWFEPGDTLKVDVPGTTPLNVTGNWLDHIPAFVGMNSLDPGPDELRIISPVLLQDKNVLGDLNGGAATETERGWAALIYFPTQGLYMISLSHMKGALAADAQLNRISFKENGLSFAFVTGTPITRARKVWVLHDPTFRPKARGENGDRSYVASWALLQSEPDVWVPRTEPQ